MNEGSLTRLMEELRGTSRGSAKAKLMGWSVEPGAARMSGKLDWLADENNQRARKEAAS